MVMVQQPVVMAQQPATMHYEAPVHYSGLPPQVPIVEQQPDAESVLRLPHIYLPYFHCLSLQPLQPRADLGRGRAECKQK